MRVLLDSHEEIRWLAAILYLHFIWHRKNSPCSGEETRVIPDILYIQQQWELPVQKRLLDSAGVTHDVLKVAIGRFIAEVISAFFLLKIDCCWDFIIYTILLTCLEILYLKLRQSYSFLYSFDDLNYICYNFCRINIY